MSEYVYVMGEISQLFKFKVFDNLFTFFSKSTIFLNLIVSIIFVLCVSAELLTAGGLKEGVTTSIHRQDIC